MSDGCPRGTPEPRAGMSGLTWEKPLIRPSRRHADDLLRKVQRPADNASWPAASPAGEGRAVRRSGQAWASRKAPRGGASRAPRRRAGKHSEPEGRGAAWTEERATKERATREGGASRAPRRRAGKHSEPEGSKAPRKRAGDAAPHRRARRPAGAPGRSPPPRP